MASTVVSPVPTQRFGALLNTRRSEQGLELEDLSQRSNGEFTPQFLSIVEKGRVPLADPTMQKLASLYRIEEEAMDQRKSELVLDLPSGKLAVGDELVELSATEGGETYESQLDYILERYLALLYILRKVDPGTKVPLRDPDLAVLSGSLTAEIEMIERRLMELMLSASVDSRTKSLLKRYLVPSAGLLVAAMSLGSLVIVSGLGSDTVGTPSLQSEAITAAFSEDDTLGDHDHDHDHDHEAESITVTTETVQRSRAELAEIGAQAEAMISYDWQSLLPGWNVKYEDDSAGYKGMTHLPTKSITIYIDANASVDDVAGVLAHEVGHAIDVTHLDDDDRMNWLEARDMPMVWWAGDGLNDFSVGAGDFAEAVAASWVDSPSNSNFGDFTPDQLDLVNDILP